MNTCKININELALLTLLDCSFCPFCWWGCT